MKLCGGPRDGGEGPALYSFPALADRTYLSKAKKMVPSIQCMVPNPLPQHPEKRRELVMQTLDLNGIENKKLEEWDKRRQNIRFRNN